MATTFLSAPQSSTPGTSLTTFTRNVSALKSFCHTAPDAMSLAPTVDSQNWSWATSLATLAPISTEMSMPLISFLMRSEMSIGLLSTNSMPLMSEMPRAFGAYEPFMLGTVRGRNWWGSTKISSVASFTAFSRLGSATMLVGSLMPGRYLTFSCVSLIISVRFFPSICSSNTHMFTVVSKSAWRSQLLPTMRAMAEPQFPEPMMATFSGIVRCASGV
mmetsp:Transcript_20685/g.53450  ORF Transcript_20685/g.53450 Transcript_20685/m.53450 type:complete len:217 (+) Transcript_20685:753-1403(+)